MASIRELRRKVKSVKSTQQITKAMKLVAAARLNKAQERIVSARPFANKLDHLLRELAYLTNTAGVDQFELHHPFFQKRTTNKWSVFLITADRGLCGGFNQNVVKAVGAFIRENPSRPIALGLVGRKGRDLLARRGLPVRLQYVNLPKVATPSDAEAIAEPAIADFTEGKVDSVYLIYNEFKSVMQQQLRVKCLLPLAPVRAMCRTAVLTGWVARAACAPCLVIETLTPREHDAQVVDACDRASLSPSSGHR